MANPKRKTSKSKRDKRKAQWLGALSGRSLSVCPNCSELHLPHHACPHCGYYKGQKVTQAEE